jgi:NAD(P)-dependent dehydrogenase (short-subunit alcohol dehydrogenase family)
VTKINNPLDLRGRRILVTGAASGIGLATCQLLSKLGGRVVAIDSNAEGVNIAVGSFEGKGHEARCFDLRRIQHISSMLVEVATEGDPLFGVVHAAGLSCIQPARLLTPNYYRDVMLVNTEAALALARGFISKKVSDPSGGSIVFVSSVMAWSGSPGAVAYAMSKAALTGIAKSLAVELAPRKIRVNCVAPGFVQSPMFDRVSGMWDQDQRDSVESEHPLGLGEPADVANAIAFLLADSGRWITGSVLVVDGGYTAH